MVEIHTHSLNKELIARCEQQVEDMLRQVFNGITSTVKKLEKDIGDEKTYFGNLDTLKTKDDFEAWSDLKNYEEKLFDFIYNKKRDYTDKFNRVKNHYFLLLNLMKKFDNKEAREFRKCAVGLNEINGKISEYETQYIETKESFINKCKERRIALVKEKDEYMVQLSKQEVTKNNPYLMKEAQEEASKLHTNMQQCVKDDKNTFEALKELEEEPARIENIKDVAQMVEHEF